MPLSYEITFWDDQRVQNPAPLQLRQALLRESFVDNRPERTDKNGTRPSTLA